MSTGAAGSGKRPHGYHPLMPAPREWFARRTFHHREFSDPAALERSKAEQGLTISVCIPALNEGPTIGPIVDVVRRELMDRVPLVDELVVIDSDSDDETAREAKEAGATVYHAQAILPELEPLPGKGEALWKSLFVLEGDLILWVDADIRNFDPRFVYGPLGPLLRDPELAYVKAFYRRPLGEGTQMTLEGGRVTELVARPLISTFWPHLAGLIQPLSGEYAGRRSVLEQVPFFTGYGVEIGLLIDIASRFGIDAIGQVDIELLTHRNRPVDELSRMAFAVLHSSLRRLSDDGTFRTEIVVPEGLIQFEPEYGEYRMRTTRIEVHERPPAVSIPAYGARR